MLDPKTPDDYRLLAISIILLTAILLFIGSLVRYVNG